MRTLVIALAFAVAATAATGARAVDVPVPVNPPGAAASTTTSSGGGDKSAEPTAKERMHASAVVGVSGAVVNLVGYAALMGGAFALAGYVGTGALLVPIIGMPVVLGMAVYIASTFVTDAPGALANTGGALLGHYVGVFLGLVSGIGAGIAYQGATSSGSADFNVNLLTFGGVGALVGAALGGTVGTAVGGGAVAALTVGDE